jgi:TctA family transporter
MVEAFIHASSVLFDPGNLLLICVGVAIGIILGATPGIGATIGVSLILPMLWAIDPGTGIIVLVAIHSAVMTSGMIPSILVRVPGSILAVATMQDGYPMTQKGEGARALGAGLASSAFGGIISVPLALVMLKVIKPIVLALSYPELTLLCVLGLSFMAVIGGSENKIKNLMAGVLGIMISMVGLQTGTGTYRYTFGSVYLSTGFDLVTIALGIFAMGEIFDLFIKGKGSISLTKVAVKTRDVLQGVLDVFRHWWLWLRCSIIGYVIGLIPGVGGELGIFIAYGYGQRSSKHPEKWGTGIVEGVIAPEAADNSTVGGTLLTTLAFGIPGEAIMALILGAFLIYGIVPGEQMFTTHLSLTLQMLIGLALANLLAGLFCLPFVSSLAKVAFLDTKYHFAVLACFVTAATFANSLILMDVFFLVPLGLLGLGLKRFGYSLPCFILGFVLGGLFEHYLWLSLKIDGFGFVFSSTYTIIIFFFIVVAFSGNAIISIYRRRRTKR